MCVCMRVCFSSPLVRLETRCDLHDICSAPRACPQTFADLTVAQSPGPSAGATECDIEVHTEGGLGGHCGAIEDEVLLEKRESGERSVTGRGPHIVPSSAIREAKEKRKGKRVITAGFSVFEGLYGGLGLTVSILPGRLPSRRSMSLRL